MLLQITNMCHQECGHCMHCSSPDGLHMTERTFRRSLEFGHFLKNYIYVITGGEPTEHPQFLDFCKYLNKFLTKNGGIFTVCSNGTWYPDKKDIIDEVSKMKTFGGMQVYTNKKWYKTYDFIMEHKAEIESIPRVNVSTEPIYMHDLGRARNNPDAQEEVRKNPYTMSCLNGHLMMKQLSPVSRMQGIIQPGLMCKPFIDYRGNVHLSESCLCQSFGNVAEDFHMEIFKNMQSGKPCMGCLNAKQFLESENPKYMAVKAMMEL